MTPALLNAFLLMAGQVSAVSEMPTQGGNGPGSSIGVQPTVAAAPITAPITIIPFVQPESSVATPPTGVTESIVDAAGPASVLEDADRTTPAEEGGVVLDQAEDIVVSGRRRSSGDPVEAVNVQSYKAVQAVDDAVVAPLARGYRKGVPKPVRRGIHNFLDNLQEPIVFLNYLLQLKPGKAAETLGRFAVNTTVGLAGVVDVAKKKPFNLPHRPNSLANTLGYYGVGPGPYLFLPLIGPTTLRDLLGTVGDRLVLPTAVGAPFDKAAFTIPANVLSALDYRVAFDESLTKLRNAPDPYAATRANYLARRKTEIDALHSAKWRARHAAAAACGSAGDASACPRPTAEGNGEQAGKLPEAIRPPVPVEPSVVSPRIEEASTANGTAVSDQIWMPPATSMR
jgi:phospholipid-binding lipoprotein MlaA